MGFAYCGGCGAPLPTEGEAATTTSFSVATLEDPPSDWATERRYLTVLFCDLVGSTGIAEQLDPEAWMALLRTYEAAVCRCILARGGTVAKHLGDGVLAWFGFPVAREADAADAVAAALDAVAAVEELQAPDGSGLRARVGIHSGDVVVGAVGGGRRDPLDVVGAAPNVAARLQAHARPGQVLLSGEVRSRIGGAYHLRSLGATRLRGVRQPVPLFLVEAPSAQPSRFRLAATSALSPLVGRRTELEGIADAWARAAAGGSEALTLIGEAGIGKSRLLQVLQTRLGHEAGWFEIDASSGLASTPFGALLDRNPTIARRASEPLGPGESALRRRMEVQARLIDWLAGLGDGSLPTVLMVEDAHWLDPSSLEVLHAAAAAPTPHGRLVLVTARPPCATPIGASLPLGPLSPTEAERLIDAQPSGPAFDRAARRRVLERAEGVPLFLEELCRTGTVSDATRLPATLTDLIAARLDTLGEDRLVAQVAACIGRQFELDLLEELLGPADPGALVGSLDRLVRADLLLEQPGRPVRSYLFRHALFADAARRTLLKAQRRPLHARIAAALQRRPDLWAERPELVAWQFGEAGMALQAVQAWSYAAHLALARSANEEVLTQVAHAERLLPELPKAERAALELGLLATRAPALLGARGYCVDETGETLQRLRTLARELGEPQALLVAVNASWAFHGVRGELARALRFAEELAVLAPEAGVPVFAHQALGLDRLWRGDAAEAVPVFDAGCARYAASSHPAYLQAGGQDPGVGCWVLGALACAIARDQDGAARRLEQGLALAATLGNPHSQVFAEQVGVWIAQLEGDAARCRSLAAAVAARAQEEGLPHWQAMSEAYLAWADVKLGNVATAAALEIAVQRVKAIGDGATLPYLRWIQVDALEHLGQPNAARSIARACLDELSGTVRWFTDRLEAAAR